MASACESLDEDWKKRAFHEVKEDPNKVLENISALRQLVEGDPALYSRTDDIFLLSFLRARKHNVKEAFNLLRNFYKIKKSYPKQLEDCLPSEKEFFYETESLTVLDQKDENERIVVISRFEKLNPRKIPVECSFQLLAMTLSLYLQDQHVQIAGITIVLDLKGFGLRHLSALTPSNVVLYVKMFQDSFPVRPRAVHIVNQPILFHSIYTLFRPFLKEKLRKRIHIHGNDMVSLQKHIPYEILPQQLGGMQSDFNFENFKAKIQQNEEMIKEWRKYGYNKIP